MLKNQTQLGKLSWGSRSFLEWHKATCLLNHGDSNQFLTVAWLEPVPSPVCPPPLLMPWGPCKHVWTAQPSFPRPFHTPTNGHFFAPSDLGLFSLVMSLTLGRLGLWRRPAQAPEVGGCLPRQGVLDLGT